MIAGGGMMEMNIEWASANEIAKHPIDIAAYGEQPEPVVRLAAVDEVIAEAVWAMEWLEEEGPSGPMGNRGYQRTQTFLASDLVAQWRGRQERKS
jgi:hypothetical protein